MTKRLIDIDDDLLTAAQASLGTNTYRETVNGALRRVVGQAATSDSADVLRRFALSTADLSKPEVMDAAWR